MKRLFFPIIVILSLLFSISGSIYPVQAGSRSPLPDMDQDGLSNEMETYGWYNLAGVKYITNSNKADSDHDGLTDSQEKLFNTHPNDPNSPGISVTYESSFKTIEYYSATDPAYLAMVQGGNRYLLTEGLVVRRGTTFKINAVNSSTATLTLTGVGMTPITPVRDPARGGWIASIPAGATVGTYTATILDGALSKSMPIYVIFQLPTDLTQAQINAFVYDDDPANKRDEVAVWWRAMDYPYYNTDVTPPIVCDDTVAVCSNEQYHTNSGFAQAFWTEQFTKKVLVDYTIPSIQGLTTTLAASGAIGTRADQAVWVNFSSVKNSFSSATVYFKEADPLHPGQFLYHMAGGACETQAGVLNSMLRSVGIASRPFALDYNKTAGHGEDGSFGTFEYDHAVMMWINGVWYAQRSFMGAEPEAYTSSPSWTNVPLSAPSLLKDFQSHFKYQDLFSDAIQTANENWDWQVGSAGGGMVNTEWLIDDVPGVEFTNYLNRDFKWDSRYPLKIQQSPLIEILNCQLWKGDGWAPGEWRTPILSSPAGRNALRTYFLPGYGLPGYGLPDPANPLENWPYNPLPLSCSPSTSAEACAAFQSLPHNVCTPLPGQTFPDAQASAAQPVLPVPPSTVNTSMQLGSIIASSGLDKNGDGRFDEFTVQFELNSSVAGQYQLGGWLKAGAKAIRATASLVTLTAGQQVLQLSFDGQAIGKNQVDGPYQVEAIWVAPAAQAVSDLVLATEMSAYQTYTYASQAYPANSFTVRAASIAGNYSYTGINQNSNGQINTILISVPLTIAIPGQFTLAGDLYDGKGAFVGHAEWNGSSSVASLAYTVANTQPPYSLEHLNLLDSSGMPLDSRYAPVYKITDLNGKVNQGTATLADPSADLSSVQSVTPAPTGTFTVTPVDTNSNTRFDQLNVTAKVNVTGAGGTYWMEGLLVDGRGIHSAWSVSTPQTLVVGTNQTLQMSFDGRMLYDQLPLTTGQSFTLLAVKIYSGTPAAPVLEAAVPVTSFSTPVYLRSQLEPSGVTPLFADDLEGGETFWTKTGAWALTTNAWNSGSHAYRAIGNGKLTLAAPLNLVSPNRYELRFRYASNLGAGNTVNLQISTNGTVWNLLKAYTGLTDYWTTEQIDLGPYRGSSTVWLRFDVPTPSGDLLLYVDDVYVMIAPAYSVYMPVMTR